jgi:hypothetical protein
MQNHFLKLGYPQSIINIIGRVTFLKINLRNFGSIYEHKILLWIFCISYLVTIWGRQP